MINYPNGKKVTKEISQRDTHGRRGMSLEDDINSSNQFYLDMERAVIYKKPTPIQIVTVDYKSRNKAKITEAYFRTPSTTDYNGVYRGLPIDFEAKEVKSKTSFVCNLIHPHQLDHLQRVLKQNSVAFVLIRFSSYDKTYYVEAERILKEIRIERKKSLPYSWFQENAYVVPSSLRNPVDYLSIVDLLYKE